MPPRIYTAAFLSAGSLRLTVHGVILPCMVSSYRVILPFLSPYTGRVILPFLNGHLTGLTYFGNRAACIFCMTYSCIVKNVETRCTVTYLCTYVRTYVRTYVCMYACMYVCVYVSMQRPRTKEAIA